MENSLEKNRYNPYKTKNRRRSRVFSTFDFAAAVAFSEESGVFICSYIRRAFKTSANLRFWRILQSTLLR